MLIVGIEFKDGVFDDQRSGKQIYWANYYINVITDDVCNIAGRKTDVLKIKRDDYNKISKYDPKDLVNKNVEILFDRKGTVVSIKVIDKNG